MINVSSYSLARKSFSPEPSQSHHIELSQLRDRDTLRHNKILNKYYDPRGVVAFAILGTYDLPVVSKVYLSFLKFLHKGLHQSHLHIVLPVIEVGFWSLVHQSCLISSLLLLSNQNALKLNDSNYKEIQRELDRSQS
uniref:Uncharacterized protein n=1 Tax=Lactuca sativa TaxID=4236 RepID=A0A9R1WNJ4_LACSA|nr:hypothetical protein LSAT_V11C100041510 [Lactuca sativa]